MNKKGFTLVELLAVIAILAILVIIAMPNVLEMFNKAKVDAFETEVQTHIKAVANEFITTGQLIYSNVVPGATRLPMDGEELDYYIEVDSRGNIKVLYVTNGDYKIEANGSSQNPIKPEDIGESIQSEVADSGTNFEMNDVGEIVGGVTISSNSLSNLILKNNTIINKTPNFNTSFSASADSSGIYKSNSTNSGKDVYYFRGNVTNNYVKFAGYTWRILRINEDNSIRLILSDGINTDAYYRFNANTGKPESMYYSKSEIKGRVDEWYENNLKDYDSYIVKGTYCEQTKVVGDPLLVIEDYKLYTDYTPTLKCKKDNNGHGMISLKVGLISYDEEVMAGSYYNIASDSYFLANGKQVMTMTPSGCYEDYCYVWNRSNSNRLGFSTVNQIRSIRPVINIKQSVEFKGNGTSGTPYEVK